MAIINNGNRFGKFGSNNMYLTPSWAKKRQTGLNYLKTVPLNVISGASSSQNSGNNIQQIGRRQLDLTNADMNNAGDSNSDYSQLLFYKSDTSQLTLYGVYAVTSEMILNNGLKVLGYVRYPGAVFSSAYFIELGESVLIQTESFAYPPTQIAKGLVYELWYKEGQGYELITQGYFSSMVDNAWFLRIATISIDNVYYNDDNVAYLLSIKFIKIHNELFIRK